MKSIKAIISDADGTLVNTLFLIRHGQYEAAAQYLKQQSVSLELIPTYEVYESYLNESVGGSTKETFEKTLALILHNNPSIVSQINFNDLDESLGPVQDRIAPLYVHPFHGLTELWSWVGQNNMKFGIYTSGSKHHVIRNFGVSLPMLGYTDLFQSNGGTTEEKFDAFITRAKAVYGMANFHIITCDDVTKTKPDPEGLIKLMNRLDIEPEEVVVIGDHPVDIQAAIAAGCHPIGITHGFSSPAKLVEAGAIRTINSLVALPLLIEKHNEGTRQLF